MKQIGSGRVIQHIVYPVFVLLVMVALSGSVQAADKGSNDSVAPAAAQQMTPEQMQKIVEFAGKALGAIVANATNNAAPAALVDFRELKALLPAEIDGAKGELKGGRNGTMGMSASHAEGRYENDQGAGVTIKIVDVSGVGGFGPMSLTAWASADIDNEDDNGYEKTTTISGNKAFEKYSNPSKSGQVMILVDKRFTVDVRGNGVPMEKIKAALGRIDLTKLAALKGKTPGS